MAKIRKRTIKAGKMLEVNYFPTNTRGQRISEHPVKTKKTKKQMDEENKRKAVKNFVRLVNTNFDENDYYITLTYNSEFAPLTFERAEKDFANYIRRIKYAWKKKGLNVKKFKYAYTTQVVTYKTGLNAGKNNYHFHLFLTANEEMSARELRELWPYGTKGNIHNYDPYSFGPEAAAKYMTREHAGKRKFKCSKNMSKPVIEDKDGQISESKLCELGKQRIDDRVYWEKKYPSYNFVRCESYFNEYNGHWYMTLIMYKKSSKNSYYEKARKRAEANLNR